MLFELHSHRCNIDGCQVCTAKFRTSTVQAHGVPCCLPVRLMHQLGFAVLMAGRYIACCWGVVARMLLLLADAAGSD